MSLLLVSFALASLPRGAFYFTELPLFHETSGYRKHRRTLCRISPSDKSSAEVENLLVRICDPAAGSRSGFLVAARCSMTRFRILQASVLVVVVFLGGVFAAAQMPPVNPAPGQNSGIIGPQLIAWSALQKPEPVPQKPQPIPGPDQAQPSSKNQQPQDQSAQPSPQQQQPEPETQQTTSQSISGTIAKVNNKYVLQTYDSVTYQLDDQTTAGQYVGKHVKVTGTLDRKTGVLRVRSIELLS